MEESKLKKILKILIIILVIVIVIYVYISEQEKGNIISNPKLSKQELLDLKIEELEEENYRLDEQLNDLSGQLEELQRNYEDAKDLIELLQEQLRDYGIEPYEL